jgi:membrane protein implicated in regulation of membrane protease activity
MQVSLGLLIGVLIAVGAFLLYVAFVGISFIGLTADGEAALAATLFAVAAIILVIFAEGFKAQFKRVKTGREALIGAAGTATTDLDPKGEVRVMSEFWEATAKDAKIPVGARVEVVGMDGLTLVVKAAEQKA